MFRKIENGIYTITTKRNHKNIINCNPALLDI